MNNLHHLDCASPIGVIEITGTDEAVRSIRFTDRRSPFHAAGPHTPQALMDCCQQLDEYFRGIRHVFTFPWEWEGTAFQKKVWNVVASIPCAETRTYKEIAEQIGDVGAIRAVGQANRRNRLSIVIPCHRVIGSDGSLTGYAGGLWRKKWLLAHERMFRN